MINLFFLLNLILYYKYYLYLRIEKIKQFRRNNNGRWLVGKKRRLNNANELYLYNKERDIKEKESADSKNKENNPQQEAKS